MDGLLIELLGLRGCGRRQVPTCACRINLQLHSRPLTFTLTVAVALFLFATFLPSCPFTASRSFPAFFSRIPFFSLHNPSLRDYYIAFRLFLPLFLSVCNTLFFPPFFSNITFFPLLSISLLISASPIFLLLRIYYFSDFLSLSFSLHVLSLSLCTVRQ